MHGSRLFGPRTAAQLIALALSAALSAPLPAGEILAGIKARDRLRCGVSEGIAGFSTRDGQGRWQGLDADFCRAVAAATLGDAQKVEFVPLKASTRFPALQARRIDLLARNTSWTLTREALLKLQFPAVLFYDGQAFMVARASGITRLDELREGSVCVEKGTTHEQNLADHSREHGLALQPLVIDSAAGAAAAFFAGRCRAYSSDASQLAAARLQAPGGPANLVILAERISKEPLGPVVSQGDEQWASAVRWVLYALILAEEHGMNQASIEGRIQHLEGPMGALLRGEDLRLARALGVQPDWVLRAVRAGGHYGELYARNLGEHSPLAIERGLNRLWNAGGLMYAPPFD
ncbi:transporter substrate-binding domain-containing protein [Pseudomonas sp. L-22-4S-12]|uniref:amino acid ABC transporter substrate-binding protein n=1 Tax=Pseudomonas sp. L-22-4S-12 TaxID=2610893 RepID=UPI0013238FBC|nr:amino acid ABC transporter substrate-binding protein [Pseudomonas sp. L-22-4S-12]MWV16157.1 transporter substrate-binding domain-containing protein [Pseudomonas sp. L-22-4S-12]